MGRCSSYIIKFKYWNLSKYKMKRASVPQLIPRKGNLNKGHGQYSDSYYTFKESGLRIGGKYYFK